MPSLPSRRGLLGGVAAGVLSLATGWLDPVRGDGSPEQALELTIVNDHALRHEVSVQVRDDDAGSAVETVATLDGTTSRDLASVLPEESDARRYEIEVAVDDRERVWTEVPAEARAVTVRIDVTGTVEVGTARYEH